MESTFENGLLAKELFSLKTETHTEAHWHSASSRAAVSTPKCRSAKHGVALKAEFFQAEAFLERRQRAAATKANSSWLVSWRRHVSGYGALLFRGIRERERSRKAVHQDTKMLANPQWEFRMAAAVTSSLWHRV